MTFKLLMDHTLKVIFHSDIRSAADPAFKNKHVNPLHTKVPQVIWSAIEQGIRDTYSPSPNHGDEVATTEAELSSADNHWECDQVEANDAPTAS